MNATAWLIVATGLLAADVPPGDQGQFQGAWVLVSSESEGDPVPPETLKASGVRMVFEGDRVIARMGDMATPLGTFALDPAANPKVYDRTYPDGTPRKGIYKLHGDTLTICIAAFGRERPSAFATRPGDGASLLVYTREKP